MSMSPRSGSSTFRYRQLPSVFNAESELDVCLARLSVLYEDLFFELTSATDDDEMRSYFVRRSVGTLREFVECLERVNGLAEFAPVRKRLTKSQLGDWNSALDRLKKAKTRIYTERNAYGGHFSHGAALAALRHTQYGPVYSLEIEWVPGSRRPQRARLPYSRALSSLSLLTGKVDGEDVKEYTQSMIDVFLAGYRDAITCVAILVDHILGPRFGF